MRNHTVIFDSSLWIALYLENDIFHYEAMRIMGGYEKRKYRIIVPLLVLIELITVLTRKGVDILKIRKICKYIKCTEAYKILSIPDDDLIELALNNAGQISLKTQDYIIFLHYVKLKPAKFESFDTKLLKFTNFYKNSHDS